MALLDFPAGTILPYTSLVAPAGWVDCDGSFYDGNLEIYKNLWSVIGTSFGGSGQSNFRVPNLGGRVPVGVVASPSGTGINGAIGSWEGASTVLLTSSQTGVKNHRHSITDPGHSHGGSANGSYGSHVHSVYYNSTQVETKNADRSTKHPDGGNPGLDYTTQDSTSVSFGSGSLNSIAVSNNTASNATSAHTNIQPEMALAYIIKL